MSHLEKSFDEDMVFNRSELKRLNFSINALGSIAFVLMLLAVIALLVFGIMSDALWGWIALGSAVVTAVLIAVIWRLSPRASRLQSIYKSTHQLVRTLQFYGEDVPVNGTLTFGNDRYGVLRATKRGPDGDSWLLQSMLPSSSEGAVIQRFEAVVMNHRVDHVSPALVAMPYSGALVHYLGVLHRLIQSETDFAVASPGSPLAIEQALLAELVDEDRA